MADDRLQQALHWHQSGQLDQAKQAYQEILAGNPNHLEVNFLLGSLCLQNNHLPKARDLFAKCLEIQPDFFEALVNSGLTLKLLGQFDQALAHLTQAYRQNPSHLVCLKNLADCFKQTHQLTKAKETYLKALAVEQDYATTNSLGLVQLKLGEIENAIASFEKAHQIDNQKVEALINLANALQKKNQADEAITHLEKALTLNPDHPAAYNSLGSAYYLKGQLTKAGECYQKTYELDNEIVEALNNQANALGAQGHTDKALALFEQALQTNAHHPETFSNLLLYLNYQNRDPQKVFEKHQQWGQVFSQPQTNETKKSLSTKRLKVGYLSPDFKTHSCAYFIEPILQNHNAQKFEIFCYAEVSNPDATTAKLQNLAHHWRSTCGLTDQQVADLINEDDIDILIDLAGHTENSRLSVMAFKPAPIQINYLGYPNTTGLPAVDYRLTDSWADPDENNPFYTEKLIRLPHGFLCYQGPDNAPAIGDLPALQNGFVTFGSFNHLPKTTPETIKLWSQILNQVKNSKLILKNKSFLDKPTCEHYQKLFEDQGIDRNRLEFISWTPSRQAHLELYNRIDIGLDTFPYNGTTTSCEALWMGVPVLSLQGRVHASRVGYSLLKQIGLDAWVCETEQQYIQKAQELSQNLEGLNDLRKSLRQKMLASSLCNGKKFTHSLEQVLNHLADSFS